MPAQKLSFIGHAGDTLAARLDMPEGPHVATALFAHCFTCGKDIFAARRISARLAAMGIAVLRFDFTGLGHSEGEFENTSFVSNAQDLRAAAQHLTDIGMAPELIIGHSLGGTAVLKAAHDIKSLKAVVTLGSPARPAHVAHLFEPHLDEIAKSGSASVPLGGRPVQIGQGFVDDIRAQSVLDKLPDLEPALLIMHAPDDRTVGIQNASEIFVAATHPKSFVTLDDADHLISDKDDAEYAASVIAAWVAKYIDLTPPAKASDTPEGVVRASEADPDGFLQDIQSGPHLHSLADEPIAYGGTNRGLSPYGYLSAGLAACTSMTLRMYARRKGWPLDHVQVDVTHDKTHAQDASSETTLKIDTFHREIVIEGDLTDDQRARLLEIADKCPVHKTLEGTSTVTTQLRQIELSAGDIDSTQECGCD